MTAFEKARRVIESCETLPQLTVAYRYFLLACKRSKDMEAKEYWDTVFELEFLEMEKRSLLKI